MTFSLSKLPNNFYILTYFSKTPSLKLFFNVGSQNENGKNAGITHLLEHLIVSNLPKYDGFTSRNKITIYKNNPSLPNDIFQISKLKLSNVKQELKRIDEEARWLNKSSNYNKEINKHNKNSIDLISEIEKTHNKLLKVDYPIIGNREILQNLTVNNIKKYFKDYFKNENIILSIGSKHTHEEIIDFIKNKERNIESSFNISKIKNNKKIIELSNDDIIDNYDLLTHSKTLENNLNENKSKSSNIIIKKYNYDYLTDKIINKNIIISKFNNKTIASIKNKSIIHPMIYFISNIKDKLHYFYSIYKKYGILTIYGKDNDVKKVIKEMLYKNKEEFIVDYIFKKLNKNK
ncbi:Peptidase M16 domain protein [Spraguea lophii 42_110]|uniref:Peptidase M16 domain protein n=1 Tax=Spraguea lophii (strain 42_110) TaxID=1358809 RepID=S7W7Z3_SPRLO|nr:Peptidase M16 domain protein [Spraguea lophii 42_110]